jgi:hypothetical protein
LAVVAVTQTCGWSDCEECAALVRFAEQREAGAVPSPPPITSAWWTSREAEAVYRRGVNLPPCDHASVGGIQQFRRWSE